MKECIYSILLTDGLKENTGCLLCNIENRLEKNAIEYFLGPSLMEPDQRQTTNQKGFCRRHMPMLIDASNRLGMALMLETHVKAISENMKLHKTKGILKKQYNIDEMAQNLNQLSCSCALCDKLNSQIDEAAKNLAYLWGHDDEFKNLFENSPMLCFDHMSIVLKNCKSELGADKQNEFVEMLYNKKADSLNKIYDDLHRFTLSFDYRNNGKKADDLANSSVDRAYNILNKYR